MTVTRHPFGRLICGHHGLHGELYLSRRRPRLAQGEARKRGDAERGRVRGAAGQDRHLQQVGLRLHQHPQPGQPAVDPQRGERPAEVGGDGAGQHRDRGGDALGDGPGDVPLRCRQREPREPAPGVRRPVRRAKAGQRGHERDTTGVGTVPATASRSAGAGRIPISVSQRSADPAVYTCPSRQYVAAPASRQATGGQPAFDPAAFSPVVTSRNAPVP